MGFTVARGAKVQRDLAPAGNHRACIVAVIYLGAHMESYEKQPPKRTEKVYVAYELLDEEGPKGPHVLERMYTASMGDRATFPKVVAAALGRPLRADEAIDLEVLPGRAVMIEVEHTAPDKDGIVYDGVSNVTAVASVLRKLPVEPKHVPFYADPDTYVDHDWLPFIYGKSVKDKIAERVVRPGGAAKEKAAAPAGGEAY